MTDALATLALLWLGSCALALLIWEVARYRVTR